MPQREIAIWDLDIQVNPELMSAAFLANEWDLYFVWLVLKAIDKANGGGGVGKVNGITWVMKTFLHTRGHHVYTKFNAGIDKYWRMAGGNYGEKKTGLLNWDYVVTRLSPMMPRCMPFKINLRDFIGDSKMHVKSILFGVVAARLGEKRPQSISAIMEHTGFSRATVYNLLKQCELLQITRNFIYVAKDLKSEEAKMYQRELIKNGHMQYRILENGSKCSLVAQIPNSYALDVDCGTFKQRPKILASYDAQNANLYLSPQKYDLHTNGELTVAEATKKTNLGLVRTWDVKNQQSLPIAIKNKKRCSIMGINEL